MVLAYASAILIIQYSGQWPNNSTQLNQTNFGLCVADLILASLGWVICFFYSLPYNSLIVNIIIMLYSLFFIAYDSSIIYFFKNEVEISDNLYNASLAIIVLGSIQILFELVRQCFGIRHWVDRFIDDDFSTVSSDFYAIKDLFEYCCGCGCDCCDNCCDSCDINYENCCHKMTNNCNVCCNNCCNNYERCCWEISDKYRRFTLEIKKAKQKRKQRKLAHINAPSVPPPILSGIKEETDNIKIPTAQILGNSEKQTDTIAIV